MMVFWSGARQLETTAISNICSPFEEVRFLFQVHCARMLLWHERSWWVGNYFLVVSTAMALRPSVAFERFL